MKLKLEDKLKIINLYKVGFQQQKIQLKNNINSATLSRIIRQYNEYGLESFTNKNKNRKYRLEFKIEIINRILNGEAIFAIASELMINDGTLHSWLKKYKELGYNGLKDKTKGRPKKMNIKMEKTNNTELNDKDKRIKELEEQNAQLEMEIDLLKKLRALVQQREQPQNKKK